MRQNAMTLLKNALKNGICPLIPLPVPRAWESGTHRKSTDVQRGDEPGGCPVSLLLQSTSSASCYVWDDRPKRLSKMVKAFLPQPTTSPSPCPPPRGAGIQALRWHSVHLLRVEEQQEPGGRKRPGAEPQWLLSQTILPSCHSQDEQEQQLASHTVTPHCFNK